MLMVSATTGLQYVGGFTAVVLSGYFAAVMWERRTKPTVRPLLLVALVIFASSFAYLVTLYPPIRHTVTPLVWPDAAGPVWFGVMAVLVIVASGFWFLFALEYTGRGGPLIRPATATVLALWTLIFGLVVFGDVSPPPEGVDTHVEFALGFGAFFMTILLVIGVLLVLTTALQRNAIGFREGVVLSSGAMALAFGLIALSSTQHPASFPVIVLLASGLFVFAVSRYPVFEAPPVVRIAGRDRLIEELDDAVVVTDLEGQVHDLNPTAEAYLGADRTEALGESIGEVLPAVATPDDLAEVDGPVEIRPSAETTLAITANRITDARNRSFGYLLVCRDVTERRRRERRLGVLTQLLTGAIIDRMDAVAENAATVARARSEQEDGSHGHPPDTPEPDPSRVGAEIRTQTSALVKIVTRTREIERALAREHAAEADIVSVIRTAVESVSEDETIDLEVASESSVPSAAIDPAVLEAILETILEGAVVLERTGVSLETADAGRKLTIHIADGPIEPEPTANVGVDRAAGDGESEQSFRELSIEMARLAATHVGGDVSTHPDGEGLRIVVEIPTTKAKATAEIEPMLTDGSADGSTETRGGSG